MISGSPARTSCQAIRSPPAVGVGVQRLGDGLGPGLEGLVVDPAGGRGGGVELGLDAFPVQRASVAAEGGELPALVVVQLLLGQEGLEGGPAVLGQWPLPSW